MSTTPIADSPLARRDHLLDQLRRFAFDEPGAVRPMTQRLMEEQRWAPAFTARVIEEYRRFLVLSSIAGHPVTPSETVDAAWHTHLLYTRSYWDGLCRDVLRHPLHHEPSRGGSVEGAHFAKQYALTIASYTTHFGPPPPDIWPPPRHDEPTGGPPGNGVGPSDEADLRTADGSTSRWSAIVIGATTALLGRLLCQHPMGPLLWSPGLFLAGYGIALVVVFAIAQRPPRSIARWIEPALVRPGSVTRSEVVDTSNISLLFVPLLGLGAARLARGIALQRPVLWLISFLFMTFLMAVGHLDQRPRTVTQESRYAVIGASSLAVGGPLSLLPGGVAMGSILATLLICSFVKYQLLTPHRWPTDDLDPEHVAVLAAIKKPDHLVRATVAQMLHDRQLVTVGPDTLAEAPPFPGQPMPSGEMARRVIGLIRSSGGRSTLSRLCGGLEWDPKPIRRHLVETGHLLAPSKPARIARMVIVGGPVLTVSLLVADRIDHPAPLGQILRWVALGGAALGFLVVVVSTIRELMPTRRTTAGTDELWTTRATLHAAAPHPEALAAILPGAASMLWMLFATSKVARDSGADALAQVPAAALAPLADSRGGGGGGCGGGGGGGGGGGCGGCGGCGG